MEERRRLGGIVGSPWFWAAAIALLFAWPIARTLRIERPEPPPVLGSVPEFSLTGHNGAPSGSADLRGRVWVAAFFCTRCPTAPDVVTRLQRIQHRSRGLGDAFRIVAFTTDPDHDTQEKLAAYAATHRVSKRRWLFLTGDRKALARVVEEAFKVRLAGPAESTTPAPLALVDAEARIRGYFDASDPGAVDALLHAAGVVAAPGARP